VNNTRTKEQKKADSNERARLRMATHRETQAYKEWLIASRERRRLLKEKYRRQVGVMPKTNKTKTKADEVKARKAQALVIAYLWCEAHIVDYSRALKARNRHREKYANNPTYAIYHRLKRWMHKHLGDGVQSRKWAKHLGYTPEELRRHLEQQFIKGMGWHNKGKWHIDHIVPVASFNITSIDCPDFAACFGLHNLRPVWAKENMRKSDRREFLL
jgi:hypothetical protein